MKNLFLLIVMLASFEMQSQNTCGGTEDEYCRIQIVTTCTPYLWHPIPIPHVVEKVGVYYVYYSELYGCRCDMQMYMEENLSSTPYKDAKVVNFRTRKKKIDD
jgi:hypothetical protein